MDTVLNSVFDYSALEWQVTISSKDKTLNFGTWLVDDNTGGVTQGNAIASSIDSPSIICGVPVAHISGAPTPPHIILQGPPALVEPDALVQTAEQSELVVWVSVYNCYDHFPDLTSFIGRQDESGNWVVEGRSPITQYGLWRVNATTGQTQRSRWSPQPSKQRFGFGLQPTIALPPGQGLTPLQCGWIAPSDG